MTSVRTTQTSLFLFRFLAIPFLPVLVLALMLDGRIVHAEPAIGSVPPHERHLSVHAVVAKVHPSVVTILPRGVPEILEQAQLGSGSNVIVDESRYILTNNDLVARIKGLAVGLSIGRLTPVRVVADDFLLDLALVKITATDLAPATLSPSPMLEIGNSVIAIGNPLTLKGGSTSTVGVVNDTDRSVFTHGGETLYGLIHRANVTINSNNGGGLAAVGTFQNYDLSTTVGQHQFFNHGNFCCSLQPSEIPLTLRQTIQRKKARHRNLLQNPLLSKAIP